MKERSEQRAGLDLDKEFNQLKSKYYSAREKELLVGEGKIPTRKEIWKLVERAERVGDEESLDFVLSHYDSILYPMPED